MLEERRELTAGMRLSKAASLLEDDPRWKVCFPTLLPCMLSCIHSG